MPKIATRLFQLLLLTQTIVWLFSKAGVDPTLKSVIDKYHTFWIISYAMLLSLSIFDKILELLSWLTQKASEKIYHKELISIVRNLKPQDKHILGQFVIDQKKEVFLNSLDDNTTWLASNKVIIRTGSVADKRDGYKLAIWARDYLTRNPNFLY